MTIIKLSNGIEVTSIKDSSILNSVLSAGVVIEYSCYNGQCGVCKTTLLEGDVIELQLQLALTEKDINSKKILTCCCAPNTDVLIDAEDLSDLKDIEVKTFPARINRIEKQTEFILMLELRLPPTAHLNFLEGQYVDITGPQGIKRSYSMASSSSENLIKFYIKKIKDGEFSQYWFNDAKENDLLRIEGPKGTFFLRKPKNHVLFLATGTGIAPIKAMLDKLSESHHLYRDITFSLYWGNRYPDEFFWEPNYTNLNFNYHPVLSRSSDKWTLRNGYIQDRVIDDAYNLQQVQIYACGSLQVIRDAKILLMANGLQEKDFYSDAFVSS